MLRGPEIIMQGRALKQADDPSKLFIFVQGKKSILGHYFQYYQYVVAAEQALFNAQSSSSFSNLYIDKQ